MVQDIRRPNILLIMTDQQQWSTAGPPAGGRTPHLDALARQGAWFRRPYTVAALCCPARASIVTGLYPHRHGMINNCDATHTVAREIASDCDSWGRRLAQAGYRMRYAGKWHAGYALGPAEYGFDTENRRFDADAYRRRLGLEAMETGGGAGGQPTPGTWGFRDAAGTFWRQYGTQPGAVEASRTAMQAEAGLEALRALVDGPGADAERPWCLWTNFTGPHNPYIVPEPYASMYDWRDVPLPPSFGDGDSGKTSYVRRLRRNWFREIDEEHTRKAIAHYWGYCTMIDHYVRKLLDVLEESGQAEHTLVAFTSDHGDMLGAHNLWYKDVYGYEETHRVPLLMRWPGVIEPGTTVDAYARTMDLGPTFLDAAAAPLLEPCHGTSLLPVLRREPGAAQAIERRELFVEEHGTMFNFTMRQVCDGRYKLNWNAFDFDELYDLQEDPYEMRNLADDPAHQPIYQRMCDRLWDWMLRLEDRYAGYQYSANVMLPRSTPPPAHRFATAPIAERRGMS
ncbi:MAG: sulfatase-like hydrolase/transferase [Chloroflexi bacterium]|nr:sulfatase-like hydrolase/transferase [Chloroflexota bacterium]